MWIVRRAQWKINQPPSLKRERASLEGLSVASFDGRTRPTWVPFQERKTSELRGISSMDGGRSMPAVQGSVDLSPREM